MQRNLSVLLICAATSTALASDLAAVEEKLVAAHDKLKSFSARFESSHQVTQGMTFDAKGTFDWARRDGRLLFRQEIRRVTTHTMEGESFKTEEHRTTLSDGRYHYQINNETKNVLKQDFDPESSETLAPAPFLQQVRNRYDDVKVLADEKQAGLDCYVVEARESAFDDGEDDPEDPMITVVREKHWFAKKLGVPVRSEGYDRQGKVVRSRVYSSFKIDAGIDAARFAFKLDGANVQDHSGG